MKKVDRKEYMKEYRKRNAERMKELNRNNYLKRKEKSNSIQQDDTVLMYIQNLKQERLLNMSIQRKRRKKRLQDLINSELLHS
ncbi:hypothetical protein C7R57_01475 [Macrococcoides caseolyticum subsp. caseolyticum]|uniref:hypothetical protein n=1 Tax=Macrococcoides caseolyticum TaxID=69966 RepID=UPI000CD284E1|nr:hypothetical protein [Macrococcus caseolyticus]PNZ69970.1 hypothetical protein CD152_11660 [Macrococcus caseolyticus]QPT47130.1 hypothetical protein I6G25_02425 [Macrococcus caseolyticus]RAK48324.1 hypothetical protein C7R57_01475 [Macrococcus caseolyticus subsp. caseolyticus]HCD18171.1 hypothetical protein [Macrococcus caseolyticus]